MLRQATSRRIRHERCLTKLLHCSVADNICQVAKRVKCKGSAVARVVSRRLPIREARVRSRARACAEHSTDSSTLDIVRRDPGPASVIVDSAPLHPEKEYWSEVSTDPGKLHALRNPNLHSNEASRAEFTICNCKLTGSNCIRERNERDAVVSSVT
jgi:hypothetical protein